MKSLTARLVLLIGALLVLAQAGNLLVWRLHAGELAEARFTERLSSHVQTLQALLDEAPPAERARRAAELSRPGRRVVPASLGGPGENAAGPTPALERLRTLLGPEVDMRVETDQGRRVHWVSFPVDGERYWLAFALPRRDRPPPPSLIPSWLALIGALAVGGGLVIVWQVSRPLRRLAQSLEGEGKRLAPIPEPPSTPDEIKRVVRTLNRLLSQLRDREQEREALLAGVSHDLRSPLARLRMRAELAGDPELRNGLLSDVQAMDRITRQFLDYVRGSSTPSQPAPLGEVLQEVAARYAELGHEVALRVEDPSLLADRGTVERIAANLIDNALAYGVAPVSVSAVRRDGQARLAVRDAGSGLSEAEFRRACEPYSRLDPARGERGHCGLGLAIVERLASNLGGAVTARRPPEGGFEVAVAWPLPRQ